MRLAFLLLSPVILGAAPWVVSPPNPITTCNTATTNVYCSYDPGSGNFLAAWGDANNDEAPVYSFYTPGTGWAATQPLVNTTQVGQQIVTLTIPTTGDILAVWGNSSDGLVPFYSVYTAGTGWSTATAINTGTNASNVFLSFDTNTGKVMGTWSDNSGTTTYSLYTPGTGWSTPDTIGGPAAETDVYNVFDPKTGETLAVWGDEHSPYYPYYAIYKPGTGWSTPATISSSPSYYDIFLAYNSKTGTTLATWGDGNSGAPTYSFYTPGHGWSLPKTMTTSSTARQYVIPIYLSDTGQFLALWVDGTSLQPTYSFYTNGSWSPPATIESSTPSTPFLSVFPAYNPKLNLILTTWADTNNNDYPTFSLFSGPKGPGKPTGFRGTQSKNNFAVVSERFNTLQWNRDPKATGYRLFRNGKLIGLLGKETVCFVDHNQPKQPQKYTLIAVSPLGRSTPATVTVGGDCAH